MTRTEALRLLNILIDVNIPMQERQLAAARLAELIRFVYPEDRKEGENGTT